MQKIIFIREKMKKIPQVPTSDQHISAEREKLKIRKLYTIYF